MLIDGELKKLFQKLSGSQSAVTFHYDGVEMNMFVFDKGAKFALSALVYEGGNYIPASVRSCLDLKNSMPDSPLRAALKVNEEKYQISLNFIGNSESINDFKFHNLLEEFNRLVELWRIKLDEHDKNDLIYVRVT